MPSARSARAPRRDPAARRPARGRPRVLAGGAATIRWDRVSRVALLKRENERLRARRAALQGSSATERESRRLGMVKPGEHPYVVEHLPKGP